MKDEIVAVTGAGGFIGGALVADLRRQGYRKIRAIDIKPFDQWYQRCDDAENLSLDLSLKESCETAAAGAYQVFNLAADMGGMGFIENNKALCMLSVLINTHMLDGRAQSGVQRFFYSSSACVYNGDKQHDPHVPALKEEDAYPALPEDGYGWEKLFSERMCRHFREDFGAECAVARYHNVYGPHWHLARRTGEGAGRDLPQGDRSPDRPGSIGDRIWGSGSQTRSFMYIDDCIKGTQMIMNSDILEPINLGSSELVTINQLVDMVEEIAGVKLKRNYKLDAPKGVNGRNSDNTLIRSIWAGNPHPPTRRPGENLRLDLRPVQGLAERG